MLNNYCAIHIITEPDTPARLKALTPVFKPSGNIKDEAKKQADVADKERAFLENARLSPVTGKICGFGWRTRDSSGCDYAMSENGEEVLLRKLTGLYEQHAIIGYDADYDADFITARSSLIPDLYSKLMDRRATPHNGLVDIADSIGLVPWVAHPAMYSQRPRLSLKDMAAFFNVPYTPAIHYDKAISDWRELEKARDKTVTYDSPEGAEPSELQKSINDTIVKGLIDKANTIYQLYLKMERQ